MTPNKKLWTTQQNVGRARYVVNFHDGHKRHPDGSPFWDIRIFSNERKRNQFLTSLAKDGYRSR